MIEDRSTPPWWLLPNVFGLDAPVVAVLWLWLLARGDDLRLQWHYYMALGLCVWCIYLLDRIIDGQNLRRRIRSGLERSEYATIPARHRFSASRPKLFIAILCPVALLLLHLAFFKLPFQSLVLPAIGLSSLVWLYLGLSTGSINLGTRYIFVFFTLITGLVGAVQFSPFPRFLCGVALVVSCVYLLRLGSWKPSSGVIKAFACGIVFASGVALPVLLRSVERLDEMLTHPEWIVLCVLFSFNCLGIFFSEEKRVDRVSEAQNASKWKFVFLPACALFAAVGIGISIFVVDSVAESWFYMTAGSSAALLGVTNWRFGDRSPDVHRALADAALVVLPLARIIAEQI